MRDQLLKRKVISNEFAYLIILFSYKVWERCYKWWSLSNNPLPIGCTSYLWHQGGS